VKLRQFPGALALGLLASLGAHTALYGGSHEMGGAYHGELVTLALAALGGLIVAFGALALTGRHAADGSVLASRLAKLLPGIAPVLISTAVCFALGERIETQHAVAGFWPMVAALVVSAALVFGLARAAIKTLADAVVAISRPVYHDRTPRWVRRAAPAFALARAPSLRRRYARPPPHANDFRA
jgi:hypothetical protein